VFRSTPKEPGHNEQVSPVSETHHAQGVAALARGDLEAGRLALLRSLQSERVTFDLVLNVAGQLASVGLSADVENLLRQSVAGFVDSPEPKAALAQFLLDSGNEQEAIQTVIQALWAHPTNPELHAIAARAFERSGPLTEEANHLAARLAIDADDLDANKRLAAVLERMGDRAGSIRCLRRVVAVTNAEAPEALTALGIALSQEGQHAEAMDLLSEVARRRPNVSAVRADLAMAQLAAGQVHEAMAGFSDALRLDERSAQAFCGMGLVYQQLDHQHEAAEAFRKTEALVPELAAGPFNLGLALIALGDRQGATNALLRAAALEPNDPEIQAALRSLVPESAGAPAPARAPAPRFSGDLKGFPLLDLLEFLRLQHKTGSLILLSRRGAGIVRVVHGQVTSASAPGVKQLGEALLEHGLITSDWLEAALALQKTDERESPEALGSLLMRDRPRDHDLLMRAVFQHLLDAFEELVAWDEGAFSFHPSGEVELPAIFFDLPTVMLQVMRRIDERRKPDFPNQEDR